MGSHKHTGPIYSNATPGPVPVDTTPAPEDERDLLRSRFAHWAETFKQLAYDIERQPSQWGHMRLRVTAELQAAATCFAHYAAGQPSPQNYRRRAEAAEALVAALQARLRQYEDPAAATRDSRHPAMPGGVP
jgi:hypothetical protein